MSGKFKFKPMVDDNLIDEFMYENSSFSKYCEFAGQIGTFEVEDSTHYAAEFSYTMADGVEARFKLRFTTTMTQFSILPLGPEGAVAIRDNSTEFASKQMDVPFIGENYPIHDGDEVFIGSKSFLVKTKTSMPNSSLRALKFVG